MSASARCRLAASPKQKVTPPGFPRGTYRLRPPTSLVMVFAPFIDLSGPVGARPGPARLMDRAGIYGPAAVHFPTTPRCALPLTTCTGRSAARYGGGVVRLWPDTVFRCAGARVGLTDRIGNRAVAGDHVF